MEVPKNGWKGPCKKLSTPFALFEGSKVAKLRVVLASLRSIGTSAFVSCDFLSPKPALFPKIVASGM